MSINLNKVAKEMTLMEELKEEVSIAQMKEILRLLFTEYSLEDIARMYLKYNK